MRILHATTFLQGGAGLVITSLAAAQRQAGHDVVVVTSATPVPGHSNYESHLAALSREGIDVVAVDSLFTRRLEDLMRVVSEMKRLRHERGAFDVVHAHAAVPALAGLALRARSDDMVVLQTMHGWGIAKTREQCEADVAVLNMVDGVVTLSQAASTQLVALGVRSDHIRVIPNGVAEGVPAAPGDTMLATIRRWHAEGREIICCAGTLGERKNQAALITAMTLVADGDGLRCLLVGDGDSTELRAHAERLGVGDRVLFGGYHPNARALVAASDLFVLPSRAEGQPMALLEAWSDRVLVLASRIPDLADLVHDGRTGLLFDPMDPADLARAIEQARGMGPEARAAIVSRGRCEVERSYTVGRMTRAYLEAYAALGSADAGGRVRGEAACRLPQ